MRDALFKEFNLKEVDADQYSPLDLAYIGDCAYELTIRSILINKGNAPVNVLNKKASNLAKAGTQCAMITAILDTLTEQEQAIYKRGRNAKSYTSAKNASISDYRKATGFEALIGWLYLKGDFERMLQVINAGFEAIDIHF